MRQPACPKILSVNSTISRASLKSIPRNFRKVTFEVTTPVPCRRSPDARKPRRGRGAERAEVQTHENPSAIAEGFCQLLKGYSTLASFAVAKSTSPFFAAFFAAALISADVCKAPALRCAL